MSRSSECQGPGREISLASLPGRKEGSLATAQKITRSERVGRVPDDGAPVTEHGRKFGCSCNSEERRRRNRDREKTKSTLILARH